MGRANGASVLGNQSTAKLIIAVLCVCGQIGVHEIPVDKFVQIVLDVRGSHVLVVKVVCEN